MKHFMITPRILFVLIVSFLSLPTGQAQKFRSYAEAVRVQFFFDHRLLPLEGIPLDELESQGLCAVPVDPNAIGVPIGEPNE